MCEQYGQYHGCARGVLVYRRIYRSTSCSPVYFVYMHRIAEAVGINCHLCPESPHKAWAVKVRPVALLIGSTL